MPGREAGPEELPEREAIPEKLPEREAVPEELPEGEAVPEDLPEKEAIPEELPEREAGVSTEMPNEIAGVSTEMPNEVGVKTTAGPTGDCTAKLSVMNYNTRQLPKFLLFNDWDQDERLKRLPDTLRQPEYVAVYIAFSVVLSLDLT